MVDALASPIRFIITPGHRGDWPQARRLVEGLDGVGHVIADIAYDANHLRRFIDQQLGVSAETPSNPSRATKLPIDLDIHKARHLVENCFLSIKRFRRISLRCEKTDSSFAAFVSLVGARKWIP